MSTIPGRMGQEGDGQGVGKRRGHLEEQNRCKQFLTKTKLFFCNGTWTPGASIHVLLYIIALPSEL